MNFLVKYFQRIGFGAYRNWSVRLSSTDPNSNLKTKVKRRSSYVSIAKQIYDSLRESETFVANYNRITPGLFRIRHLPPASWYCLSDVASEILFEAVKARVSPGNIIIEMNPGLGLITRKLLSLGPSALYAYEPDPNFREILSSLASDHPELTIFPKQFLNIWKEDFKEKLYGDERLSRFLPNVEPKDWKSDPTVQIIGAVPSNRFVQYFLSCVTFQQGIITYGRPELFFVTTPEIFVQLKYDRTSAYSALCVRKFARFLLFSIYFDLECLCEVDDRSFVPWFRKRKTRLKSKDVMKHDVADRLVFVRAVPKRDLYDIIPPNLLRPLWFFINQAVLRPKSKVIPYLEKWVTGCGPMFIVKGISVFTEFRDLSPPEILDVFLTFAKHPDYETSLFNAAVESYVFKGESDALDDEADAVPEQKTPEDTVDNAQDDSADRRGFWPK